MRRIRRGGGAASAASAEAAAVGFLFVLFLAFMTSSCGANESILKSGKETPVQANAESGRTAFAIELEAMRTADFRFVHVLRRKDGRQIDAEDRGVIRLNTGEANRRIAADDDKAFIIGSNVQIPAENMIALVERFTVENYSPPSVPVANTNVNDNK